MESIRVKLRETHLQYETLAKTEEMEKFYATVNAFLAAARSVLYVARHELGWEERLAVKRVGISKQEEAERKKFDAWYSSSPVVKAILDHPLTDERHSVIHREGQAGFLHVPQPIGGLAVDEGNAFHQASFISGGRWGLPLEDKNYFFYVRADGTKVDAVVFCKGYLDRIDTFYQEVVRGVWR